MWSEIQSSKACGKAVIDDLRAASSGKAARLRFSSISGSSTMPVSMSMPGSASASMTAATRIAFSTVRGMSKAEVDERVVRLGADVEQRQAEGAEQGGVAREGQRARAGAGRRLAGCLADRGQSRPCAEHHARRQRQHGLPVEPEPHVAVGRAIRQAEQ